MSSASNPSKPADHTEPRFRDQQRLRALKKKSADPESLRRRVYGDSNIAHYSPLDQLMIEGADLIFYSLIRTICATLRWEVRGEENLDRILESGHQPIFAFWHECILPATFFWRGRGIVVMSSMSRDAEYTGRVIKRFGYGTARGSATRGGGRALAELAECLASGMEVAFTIDGPRGPSLIAKAGAVTLARHTGQAILPFHIALAKHFELPTWDRLQIPGPFCRAAMLIGEPIYVDRDSSADDVSAKQNLLQSSLDRLRMDGEAWQTATGRRS